MVLEEEEEEGEAMKMVTVVVRSGVSIPLYGGHDSGLKGKRESWCWWQCGGDQGFLSPQGHLLHSPH